MTIASPCVRQCTLDARQICQGCRRTLDEIAAWSAASDREKLAMLAAIRRRAAAATAASAAGAAADADSAQPEATPRRCEQEPER